MSHTIEAKFKSVRFDIAAVCRALERLGYKKGVDYFIADPEGHTLIDYVGKARTKEPKAQIWIDRRRVVGAEGTPNAGKRELMSNDIGFRAGENGELVLINNQFDSRVTFTPKVQAKLTQFVAIELLKAQAKAAGHATVVEKQVGNQIRIFVQ